MILEERSFAQKTTLFSFFWEENITKRGGKLNSASFIMCFFVVFYVFTPYDSAMPKQVCHCSCCAAYSISPSTTQQRSSTEKSPILSLRACSAKCWAMASTSMSM